MTREIARVLEKKGFAAQDAADIFVQNSLANVYSHGLNRFPRVVRYWGKGEMEPRARASGELRAGVLKRWDGHRGDSRDPGDMESSTKDVKGGKL